MQALRVLSRCPRVLERTEVVVRQHLGPIFCPIGREGLHPFRGAPVLLRPQRARDLPVGDVSDDDVRERELRLAVYDRVAFAADELLPLELEEMVF